MGNRGTPFVEPALQRLTAAADPAKDNERSPPVWASADALPETGIVILLGDAGSGKSTWLNEHVSTDAIEYAPEWRFRKDDSVRLLSLDEVDRERDSSRLQTELTDWLRHQVKGAHPFRLLMACRSTYWFSEAKHWRVLRGALVFRLLDFDAARVDALGEQLGVVGLGRRIDKLVEQGQIYPGRRRPQDLVWLAESIREGELPADPLAAHVERRLVEPDPAMQAGLRHLPVSERAVRIGRALAAALIQGQDGLALAAEAHIDGVELGGLPSLGRDREALLALPLFRAAVDAHGDPRWYTEHRRIDEYLAARALRAATARLPVEVVASALGPRFGCPAALFGLFHAWLECSEPADQATLTRWDPVAALAWPQLQALPLVQRARWFNALVDYAKRPDAAPWFLATVGWERAAGWLDADLATRIEDQVCELLQGLVCPPDGPDDRALLNSPSHLHVLVLTGIEAVACTHPRLAEAARQVFRASNVPTWIRRRALEAWHAAPSSSAPDAVNEDVRALLDELRAKPLKPAGHLLNEPERREDGRDDLVVSRLKAVIPDRFGFGSTEAGAWLSLVFGTPSLRASSDLAIWRLEWQLTRHDARALFDAVGKSAVALRRHVHAGGYEDPWEISLAEWVGDGAAHDDVLGWVVAFGGLGRESPLVAAISQWAASASPEDWHAFCFATFAAPAVEERVRPWAWLEALRPLSADDVLTLLAELPVAQAGPKLRHLWLADLEDGLGHHALRTLVDGRDDLRPVLDDLPDSHALRERRATFAAERRAARAAQRHEQGSHRSEKLDGWLNHKARLAPAARAGDEAALLAAFEALKLAQIEQRPLPPALGAAVKVGPAAWVASDLGELEPPEQNVPTWTWLLRELVHAGLAALPNVDGLTADQATGLLVRALWCDARGAHAEALLRCGADGARAVAQVLELAADHSGEITWAESHCAEVVFVALNDDEAARLAWEALLQLPRPSFFLTSQVKRRLTVVSLGVEPSGNAAGWIAGLQLLRVAQSGGDVWAAWARLPNDLAGQVREVVGDPFAEPCSRDLDRVRLQLAADLGRSTAEHEHRLPSRLRATVDSGRWPGYAKALLLAQAKSEHVAIAKVKESDQGMFEGLTLDLDPDAGAQPSADLRRWHHQRARDELRQAAAALHRSRALHADPRVVGILAGVRPQGTRGVFLCYGRNDSEDVRRLYDALGGRLGAEVVFMDTESIEPGEAWYEILREGLGRAALLVVWGTEHWLKAPYPRWELGYAQAVGAQVCPIVDKQNCEADFKRLRGIADFQWLEMPRAEALVDEAAIQDLARRICQVFPG